MDYKTNPNETNLFILKVICAASVWFIIALIVGAMSAAAGFMASEAGASIAAMIGIIGFYALIIVFFVFLQKVILIGCLKGDGICVSERQFPEVHRLYVSMAEKLGIKKIPPLFILQHGGVLNAFAIRFSRKNYVAVYSDVFAVYESDPDALAFVLGHELGHVKRNHMSKAFWTLPADIYPFLGPAYSRACEYTCDNIGCALTGTAKLNGLLLLAGGADLYRKINALAWLEDAKLHKTASVKFTGLFMSHPWLPARVENLKKQI
jgi:Zn-dependent protease with chaperone function